MRSLILSAVGAPGIAVLSAVSTSALIAARAVAFQDTFESDLGTFASSAAVAAAAGRFVKFVAVPVVVTVGMTLFVPA